MISRTVKDITCKNVDTPDGAYALLRNSWSYPAGVIS